jgi:hypothetical protein
LQNLHTVAAYLRRFSDTIIAKVLGIAGVLAATVASVIHPLTYGLMPATPDGLLHLYRLVALDHAIQHGAIWPRFVPGFLYGYGAPVFNYYAPLSLYIPEALHLVGLSFLNALLVGMMVYAVLGAIGAYFLGRVWGGPVAGMMTSVSYTCAPYLLYDWPRRGAVAEFAALAILPWVLWTFWRSAAHGQRRDLVLAVIALSVLILTHNITALFTMPILIAYSAYLWWTGTDPRRGFVRLGLAGLFALLLTAFFWLPALGETGYVHIDRVTYGVANLDFHNNFQPLAETFAPPLTADLTQMHPPVPRTLAWPAMIFAVLGAALVLWRGALPADEQKRLQGFLIVCVALVVLLLFLMTSASTLIWEVLPLMNYIQFPWRLLGPLSLILALWAGIGVSLIARQIPWTVGKAIWIGICTAWMILYALPWLYGAYISDPPARTIVDAQNFERETGWLAGTAAGEYIPIWTEQIPDPDRLLGLYAESDVIPRLQPNPDVTVIDATWRTMGGTLRIEVQDDTRLLFDWLYFPGWWVQVDDQLVWIEPAGPQGYMSASIPEGEHTVEIGFGPTPLRLGAMIASGVGVALLIAALIFLPEYIWRADPEHKPVSTLPASWLMLSIAIAALVMFTLKALWIDNAQSPIKRARFVSGIEAGVETPVLATFNREITLLGYDLNPRRIASGSTARLNLYWQLIDDLPAENYTSVIYLQDAAGNILQQIGSQHPGDQPTTQWVPGLYIQERLQLAVPPGTPPGTYTIHAALYSQENQRNLDTFDAAGSPLGLIVQIGALEVLRPFRAAQVDIPDDTAAVNAALNDALTLLWTSKLPAEMEVGQIFPLTWVWRAHEDPLQTLLARVVWMQDDEVKAESQLLMLAGYYPTELWQRGDVWKGIHLLYVPGRLAAGEYQIGVQLMDTARNPVGDIVEVGEMRVMTPPRSFDLPDVEVEADAQWQNGITLIGYDLPEASSDAGDAINLTLYWQPQSDIGESLTLFVHLVDDEGNIVAQVDQIPMRGVRPTTGWAPGEVIADTVQLFVQPETRSGLYHIRVGWYNAVTAERILMRDDAQFWMLPKIISIR